MSTPDPVAVAKAWRALQRADALLCVADGTDGGLSCSLFIQKWLIPSGEVVKSGRRFELTEKGIYAVIGLLEDEGERLHSANRIILERLRAQAAGIV